MGTVPHVIIVGGGFGGLAAARALRRAPVDVTLIDRRNHHLFQPLLYQVATGELSPANIASPLRALLRDQSNCRVVMDEARDIDPSQRKLILARSTLTYDRLIVATGVGVGYFGRDDWRAAAPGLKSLDDATNIRRRILTAFERAEIETATDERNAWLTFVIVGGGPTGVELAGALSEVAKHTLRNDFRRVAPEEAKIILVEAGPSILSSFGHAQSSRAAKDLARLGVEVRTETRVVDVSASQVSLETGNTPCTLGTRNVIWAAGISTEGFSRRLAERTEATLDRAGRIVVSDSLTLERFPEIHILGDVAAATDASGRPLPGVAPVAIQQGRHVARNIRRRLKGSTVANFRFRDPGSMAVIGRYRAVANVGKARLSGLLAWSFWLAVHLMSITQFRNRVLVCIQWGWTFLTRDRSARLITDSQLIPPANTKDCTVTQSTVPIDDT